MNWSDILGCIDPQFDPYGAWIGEWHRRVFGDLFVYCNVSSDEVDRQLEIVKGMFFDTASNIEDQDECSDVDVAHLVELVVDNMRSGCYGKLDGDERILEEEYRLMILCIPLLRRYGKFRKWVASVKNDQYPYSLTIAVLRETLFHIRNGLWCKN